MFTPEPRRSVAERSRDAVDFAVRNAKWMRRKRAYSLNHAILAYRFAMLRVTRPWIETDGMTFLGRDVDLSARRGMGHLRIGKFVWIGNGNAMRCHEGHLSIGDKTVFGSNNTVNCYLDIEIGSECIFADWIYVCDFDHRFADPHLPIRSQGIDTSPVRVGNGVWVGEKSTILRGVSIGDGAVIGSHALVTRDVPPGAVVGGVPAKVLKFRPGWEDGMPEQRPGTKGW